MKVGTLREAKVTTKGRCNSGAQVLAEGMMWCAGTRSEVKEGSVRLRVQAMAAPGKGLVGVCPETRRAPALAPKLN